MSNLAIVSLVGFFWAAETNGEAVYSDPFDCVKLPVAAGTGVVSKSNINKLNPSRCLQKSEVDCIRLKSKYNGALKYRMAFIFWY